MKQGDFTGLLLNAKDVRRLEKTTMYRKVWETAYSLIPSGYEVHHLDIDANNNRLANLACLHRIKHRRRHGNYTTHESVIHPNMVQTITHADPILTPKEVISILGISPQKLYRLLRKKIIPAHKVGRQWRFIKTEIQRWLETSGYTT